LDCVDLTQVCEPFAKDAFFEQTKEIMLKRKPAKFAEDTPPQPKLEVRSEMPPSNVERPAKEEKPPVQTVKDKEAPKKAEAAADKFLVVDLLTKTADDEILKKLPPEDIPEGVTVEDLLNPDRVELIGCLSFLEKYNADIEKYKQWLIMEGHRAASRKCDDGIMRGTKEALMIPVRFKKGELTQEQYKANIERILSIDQKLAALYRKLGMIQRLYLVEERMKYINQELPNL
jgi:hypothetical protein